MATFGVEPSPFPEDAEEGASGLLDWLLGEFEDLGKVLTNVSDSTAVRTCESVLAILAHEGCPELEKIASRDYVFPEHSELEENIAKVQAVKKSFLRKFWKVSGREVVREIAQRRMEEVNSSFVFLFLMSLVFYFFLDFLMSLSFFVLGEEGPRSRKGSC